MTSRPPPFATDPVDGFFIPGRDTGLQTLSEPGPLWHEMAAARLDGIGLSQHEEINTRWSREQRRAQRTRLFRAPVELSAEPVVLDRAHYIRTFASVNGKWFLNGAGGARLFRKYAQTWREAHPDRDWDDAIAEHLNKARASTTPPIFDGSVKGLDFVLEARNFHNYYHFIKETFCHLTLIDEIDGFDGRIRILAPGGDVSDFVLRWLQALFPEWAERVVFEAPPQTFERVLSVMHGDYAYFRSTPPQVPRFGDLIGPGVEWDEHRGGAPEIGALYANSVSRSLRLLRARALRQIAGKDFGHLPRRVWIGRKARGKRDRSVVGEARLVEALKARGFAEIYFEDLAPLEQVALMANAEVVVTYHGAGLTNMLYASPTTNVVEIGTIQSAILRRGDFLAFANASGAAYTVAAADAQHDGPNVMPRLRGGKLYAVAISDPGIDALMGYLDAL